MGGSQGAREYLYQTYVMAFDLLSDPNWVAITIEPDTASLFDRLVSPLGYVDRFHPILHHVGDDLILVETDDLSDLDVGNQSFPTVVLDGPTGEMEHLAT